MWGRRWRPRSADARESSRSSPVRSQEEPGILDATRREDEPPRVDGESVTGESCHLNACRRTPGFVGLYLRHVGVQVGDDVGGPLDLVAVCGPEAAEMRIDHLRDAGLRTQAELQRRLRVAPIP
jgi:hypothetical protein